MRHALHVPVAAGFNTDCMASETLKTIVIVFNVHQLHLQCNHLHVSLLHLVHTFSNAGSIVSELI